MQIFQRLFEKKKLRLEAVQKAREGFTSWLEISQSDGWKAYEERVNREIEIIENQMLHDVNLSGDDLKKLQLALKVWDKVKLIPKKLEDNAKAGGK